jgi:DNA-binding NarL/FixJ family response regulator
MALRVVLGEDNYLVREGITRALERIEGFELVATGEDLGSLLEAVESTSPDVVLTDIRMPPTYSDEGIRVAVELRRTHPDIGVVILSQHVVPAYALALLAGGSDGRAYLLKERIKDQNELRHALLAVAEGRSLVDSRIVERLLEDGLHRDPQLDRLTPRERQTLAMIAEGRSNSAIAEELMITRRAVERHINSIFLKLELKESDDVNRRVRAALLYLAGEPE